MSNIMHKNFSSYETIEDVGCGSMIGYVVYKIRIHAYPLKLLIRGSIVNVLAA